MHPHVPNPFNLEAIEIQLVSRARIFYLAIVNGVSERNEKDTGSSFACYPTDIHLVENVFRAVMADLRKDPLTYPPEHDRYSHLVHHIMKRTQAETVFSICYEATNGSGYGFYGDPKNLPWILTNMEKVIADNRTTIERTKAFLEGDY